MDILDKFGKRWWTTDVDNAHRDVIRVCRQLQDQQKARIADGWRHARLYAGMRPDLATAFGALGYVSATMAGPTKLPRFSFNAIESVVSTCASRNAANEIIPTYLTDGGDYDQWQKGEALGQFIAGVYHEVDFRQIDQDVDVDAQVFGTGVSKFFEDQGRIRSERVFPLELLVDDEDGMYRKPRQLMQTRAIAREVITAMFPKFAAAIERAPIAEHQARRSTVSDMVQLVEAWHLPSGPEEKDGRHVICIEGCDLEDEPWTRDRFPFEFLRWKNPILGFWGKGISEALTGIQIEINRLVSFVQQSLSASAFKIFLEVGSKVVQRHLNKEMGGIIEYQGAPPTFFAPNTLEASNLQWLMTLWDKAFEEIGVSKMSAQNLKPAGLDSGKAIRAYDDIQDARFTTYGQRRERWHVDSAEQMIDLARRIHEREGSFKVTVPGADFLNRVNWSDISLERDEYIAQVFPTSALPRTPSARLQSIQELMQAGMVDPQEGRQMLRMPDTKAADDLDLAPRNFVMWQVSQCLNGKYEPPDPLQDLQLGKKLFLNAYNMARVKSVPEGRISLLRQWLSTVDALEQQSAANQPPAPAPAPGGPAPMGGPPQARPAPPPTSDLLPNMPGGGMPPAAA